MIYMPVIHVHACIYWSIRTCILCLGWALFQKNICKTERSDNEEQFDRSLHARHNGSMIDCRGRRLNDKILENLIKIINFLLRFVFNYQFTCNVNYISRYHIGQCSIKHVLHCVGMTKAYLWQSGKNIIQKTDQKKIQTRTSKCTDINIIACILFILAQDE